MNRLLSFRYARTVMYLVAVLLAFLVIVDVLILYQQRRYFRDEAGGLVEHDVELVGVLLGRELLRAGYDRAAAEGVLARWMDEHPDVVELRASTPEGGVVAEVSREAAHGHLFHVEHAVRYGEKGVFSLEMVKYVTPLEKGLRNLSLELVLASVLIAGMMGAVLWLTFRKTAIRPLETEIAERRRAEDALRESEEKFRAIFDYAMDGIALADGESNRISIANETLCRMLGQSQDELRLMTLMDVHPVGFAPRVAGGPGRGKGKVLYSAREIPVKRKDGSLFFANVTGAPVSLGGKEYVMGIFRDVTDRRRAEEALRESEGRYRTFVHNFHGIAFRGDMDFVPVFFHGAVEEITGYAEKDFVSGAPRWDQVIHEDDMPLILDSAVKLREVPGTSVSREYRIVRKDGEVRWVFEVIQNLCDDSSRPSHVEGAIYDITDRKRAEEEVLAAQARLEQVLAASSAAVYSCEPVSPFAATFISENIRNLTGYEPREFLREPGFWADRIHPEDAPRVFEELPELFEKDHHAHEYRWRVKSGAYIWVYDKLRLVRNARGEPVEMVGAWMDITARRRAEEALRDSEEKFRAIFDNARDGIALANAESKEIFLVNETFSRMLGYGHDELTRMKVFDIHPEGAMPYVVESFDKVAAEKSFFTPDVPMKRKDGNVFYAEVTGAPVVLGGIAYLVGIFRDITGRMQMERELREHHDFLQVLMDTMPSPVYYKDAKGVYLGCNGAFAELLGLGREDIIGKTVFDIAPRELAEIYHDMDRALFREPGMQIYEHSLVDAAGNSHEVIFNKATFLKSDGSLGGLVGIVQDITGHKQAEESLRSALREKEVLLNEVHHRVKNNLTVVSSLVSLQRRRIRDSELQGFLLDMESRIRSIAMVHENLYQSRDLANINFSNYLSSLTSTIFRFYDTPLSSVGLKLDVPHELCFDVSTMVPCGLILNELLTNALKYAFPGGQKGELSVSLGPRDEGRYTLAVRDNGVGLPEGLDVRKAESLGLRLVGLLTEQLDGDLDVVRGGGTEFRITFKAN